MTPIAFDAETHTYSRDGRKVFGVTESLGLVYPQFDGVPVERLIGRRKLGLAGHAACELDDLGKIDAFEIHPQVAPGLTAWKRFKRELGFEPRFVERLVFCPTYDFAGRADVLGLIPGQTALDLVDRKFVRKISALTPLQLGAYRLAARDTFPGERIGRRIVVQIEIETGRYQVSGPYVEHQTDTDRFLRVLDLARFGVEKGLYKLAERKAVA